jgi:hypothetical protein
MPGMSGLNRFTQFRAWRTCVAYKKAVYAICKTPPLSTNFKKRQQLEDLVDADYITEAKRQELNALAQEALQEVTGLLEYLQSPEALRDARRARERRIASRQERHSERKRAKERSNAEPEHEPGSEHTEG